MERATAELLGGDGLEHDRAQEAIGACFGGSWGAAERLLDEAALPLFGSAGLDAREQARLLAERLTDGLCLWPDCRDHRALLLDHALTQRRAHPLQIAVIGHELARRAGIDSFVGVCQKQPWTVVRGEDGIAMVGPGSLAGPPCPSAIRRRCPHEVAHAVLREIDRQGPPTWGERAERLLRALPVRSCGSGEPEFE